MARDNHTDRVRHHRGKASQYDCVDCGRQALDWSQRHGTRLGLPSDNDPDNFDPRCRRCHWHYDRDLHQPMYDARWTPESKTAQRMRMASNRAAISAAQWTPEKREEKRQETIVRNKEPISEERRRRLSESHAGKPWSPIRRAAFIRRYQGEEAAERYLKEVMLDAPE